MSQIYFLAVVYLLVGSGFLLSDSFGIRYPLLLSLRFRFRNSKRMRRLLVLGGVLLAIGLFFLPYRPGPMFLGDLLPLTNVTALLLWYGFLAYKTQGDSVLEATGKYVERNKRVFGYVTATIALLHFFVPWMVLL